MTVVSVVTAVYNRRDTVLETLTSVLNQRNVEIETVVIDGASTDGTLEVLEGLRERLSVMVSEPDRGIYHALNKGLGRSGGDVVGFLHADDVFPDEGAVARIAIAFEDPAVDAIYGDLVYVDRHRPRQVVRYWKAGTFEAAKLLGGWMPPHPTFYARRRVYETFGGFDTRFRISADYDLMLRILAGGRCNVRYLPEVLVRMRLGGISNGSIRNILRKSREDYRIMREHRIGGLGVLARKNLGKIHQFWTR